jgi:GNAT superfamily N-acetyltransferase
VAELKSSIEFIPEDLASGDARAMALDVTDFEITRIVSSGDPLFAECYGRLWQEFGPVHEMESSEVIMRRLNWLPALRSGNFWLRYEMLLLRKQGQFVAARDHTAVIATGSGAARAVVHMSHVLVEPAWRRTGVAGWLRAWPIQTARAGLKAAGLPSDSAVTLLAEMEHPDPAFPNRTIRLQAYEKAGFKKVDPTRINYLQPDFRTPAAIDEGGGPRPLPFGLVLRRVGREQEQSIGGAEVREIVEALYQMYGTAFRASDMAPLWESLKAYPESNAEILLVPPSR